jgi:hypothetical protein
VDQLEPTKTRLVEHISKFFHCVGYTVPAPKSVNGRFGCDQAFDLSAVKADEEILLDIFVGSEVGPKEIVEFFAKIYDTKPKRPLLVCVLSLNHDARSLVEMYKIENITAKDTDSVLSALSQIFDSKQTQPFSHIG